MAQCKKDVTWLLMHWSYAFLTLTHRNGKYSLNRGTVYIKNHISSQRCIHVLVYSWDLFEHSPYDIDGLVQDRPNSSALAMELCLSGINPSIYTCNIGN